MLKHEVKVELQNSESLKQIIEKAYFEESNGKINGNKNFFTINEESEPEAFEILKEFNNTTVKICNIDTIDGSARFIVESEEREIRLFPASIYCIKEDDKYSFY
jgi:hypothetical protein